MVPHLSMLEIYGIFVVRVFSRMECLSSIVSKQLAVSYGLGIRFDLDFLILRFDGGMKAVNPMYTGRDHFPIISPDFKRDFAFHFAVGYPF